MEKFFDYSDDTLKLLLNGNIAAGYREREDKIENFMVQNPSLSDKVHAILILYDITNLKSPEDNTIKDIVHYNLSLTKLGLQPIIVLTKLDKICVKNKVVMKHTRDIYENGIINDKIEEFSKITGISRSNIFPIINYTGSADYPDPCREFLFLKMFKVALDSAITKLEFQCENYDEVIDAETNQTVMADKFNENTTAKELTDRISQEHNMKVEILNTNGSPISDDVANLLVLKKCFKLKNEKEIHFCKNSI